MTSLLQPFLRQLGYALLEHHGGGAYSLLTPPPSWFTELWGIQCVTHERFSLAEKSSFLEHFLSEAESYWKSHTPGACDSGIWIEKAPSGKEIPLQATALSLEGKSLLALQSPDPQYHAQAQLLQSARTSALEHEHLLREIQKKEILLHCIVHDLSQPLSAMRGSLECLGSEADPERAAKFIELGKNASEQQELMIREILQTFSADLQTTLEAEKQSNGAPDLLVVAQEAMASFAPAFAAKGVNLTLDPRVTLNANWRVRGEQTRLRRIFTNLLENALRYSPSGGRVTVGMEDSGDYRQVSIDDEGPGLPPDLRPAQIFALFGQGKEGGGKAGLGLYFCRITVERWGGTIGCASLADVGSRFWFRLPKAQASDVPATVELAAHKASPEKNNAAAQRSCMRILLADDQEDIRSLTTIQLERSGHHVTSVPDGKTALKAAQRDRFDVALLDEEMPGLTGVQVARAICENANTKEGRPILIALTGNNSPEDRERLRAAGFDAVIAKPFHLETLATLLRDPTHIPPDATIHDSVSGSEPGSVEDILKRIGGDKKLLCQMIATFQHDTPKRMATIKNMLKRKDGVELSSHTHALKGSVSIFGAVHARQHCQALQDLGRIDDFAEANRVYPLLQEEIAKLLEKLRGYAEQAGARPVAKIAGAESRAKTAKSPRRSPGKKRRKPGLRRKK